MSMTSESVIRELATPARGSRLLRRWVLLCASIALTAPLRAQADGSGDAALADARIRKVVYETLAEQGGGPTGSPFSIYGDFRFRHESNFRLVGKPDRHRERLRLRIGGKLDLQDDLQLGVRLVTGPSGDPNSTHADFGNVFDSLEISIDDAFLAYNPTRIPELTVVAGKMAHPFRRSPVYGELVWDGDVHPEGAYGRYRRTDAGPFSSVEFTLAQYVLLHQSTAKDSGITALQVAGTLAASDVVSVSGASGYMHVGSTSPDGSQAIVGDNGGNRTVDQDGDGNADAYKSRFGILDSYVAVRSTAWEQPVDVTIEWIRNLRAGSQRNGWAIGGSVGKAKEKGDWRAFYQYAQIERDSVFSPVAQDDFLQQTNFRGHVLGGIYQLADKIGLKAWFLISSRDHKGTTATTNRDFHEWRARLELNIKF